MGVVVLAAGAPRGGRHGAALCAPSTVTSGHEASSLKPGRPGGPLLPSIVTHRSVFGFGEPVGGLPRRRVLQGLAGVGVAAAAAPVLGSPARAAPLDWDGFDRAIRGGFDRMHI